MRDVTPPNENEINFKEVMQFLIEFVKHPVEKVKSLPDWNWQTLFVLHLILAVVSGMLAGILKFNFYRIAAGLFLMPVVSTVAALLMTMFLYYYLQFFENKNESFRRLFTMVVLCSVPFYLFQVLSEYVSFISVIGFAMTSLLGIVGLTENFRVPRRKAQIAVGVLFGMVFITWLTNNLV